MKSDVTKSLLTINFAVHAGTIFFVIKKQSFVHKGEKARDERSLPLNTDCPLNNALSVVVFLLFLFICILNCLYVYAPKKL